MISLRSLWPHWVGTYVGKSIKEQSPYVSFVQIMFPDRELWLHSPKLRATNRN